MFALEERQDALESESARQNLALQRAQAQRKTASDEPRARLQLVDPADLVTTPVWQDKLQAIPALRSALIPLDETSSGESWSKPFSLIKADFEPWLSFYSGYRSSRLFLERPSRGEDTPVLDFAIRALIDLKRFDSRLIIEPLVQIDGPVEYFDAERAPRPEQNQALSQSLARASEAMHRGQLRRAVERGRQMGDELHEALLGDGLANLIRAWEKAHQRKPSVQELHIMLTNGRTNPLQPSPAPPANDSQVTPVVKRPPPVETPSAPVSFAAKRPPHQVAVQSDQSKQPKHPGTVPLSHQPEASVPVQTAAPSRRPLFWYFAHAVGLTAAGALTFLLLR